MHPSQTVYRGSVGRARIWSVRVALALVLVLSARPGAADEEAASGTAAVPRLVFITTPSSLEILSELTSQLRELTLAIVRVPAAASLSLPSQALAAAQLAGQHGAIGTIWLEQHSSELRVYVYDVKHRQLARRTLLWPDVTAREELAVVLRSAISAIIAGEASSLEPVALVPVVRAPRKAPVLPTPAPSPSWSWQAGSSYTGTSYAPGTFQSGLELSLMTMLADRALAGIGLQWVQPVVLSGGGADAVLHRYPAELFGAYAFAQTRRFRAYVESGLQVELVRRTTRLLDPQLVALPDDSRFRLALSPRLRVELGLSARLLGFAAFGADISADRYDYVVQSARGPVRLAARSVRPRLGLGLAVRF